MNIHRNLSVFSTHEFGVYFGLQLHTVNPSDATDFEECNNDYVKSARIPVKQSHYVDSSLYTRIHKYRHKLTVNERKR